MRRSMILAAGAALLVTAAPARADDIANAITEAQRAYQASQFQAAQTALQEAL